MRPIEGESQRQILVELRYRIDTAIKYPFKRNIDEAVAYAEHRPGAIRSAHLRHNLGQRRWEWLNSHGVTAVGEATEIAGQAAFKVTSTPDITK